jgi:hypothetical protein
VVLTAVLVALFLWVFKPFGLEQAPVRWRDGFILGYGLVTLVVAGVLVVLIPLLFPARFREPDWTVGKNMAYYTLLLFCIACGNAWYTAWVYGMRIRIQGLLLFQLYTIAVGAVVAALVTLIRYLGSLRLNRKKAELLNQELQSRPAATPHAGFRFTAENGKDELRIPYLDLFFIESADNYSSFCYREGRVVKRRLLRGSLRMFEEQVGVTDLIRCHRSYLVNLRSVAHISGNSQGYRAHFEGTDESIPVSRKAGPELHRHLQGR